MKYTAILLVFLAGCAGCASIPAPRPEFGAAVRLDFYGGGNCSGTAVAEYAIVTAAHCFKGGEMGGMLINGQSAAYQILANDGNDHVLMRVTARQDKVARLGKRPAWGQSLALIGNPVGLSKLFRTGRVAGFDPAANCLDEAERKCPVMFVDLNTAGGDSGAGYFNTKGELVGVHSGSYAYGIWKVAFAYDLAFTEEQWKAAGV